VNSPSATNHVNRRATNTLPSVISYPLAVVNAFVAFGLIWLYTHREKYNWNPPFRATLPVAIFFFISNVYLIIAPFVPPENGVSVYETLPYYLHCVVGIAIIAGGGVYWLVWAVVLPKLGKYELMRETSFDEIDGWERSHFVKRPVGASTAFEREF
jgi:hypothetical protein